MLDRSRLPQRRDDFFTKCVALCLCVLPGRPEAIRITRAPTAAVDRALVFRIQPYRSLHWFAGDCDGRRLEPVQRSEGCGGIRGRSRRDDGQRTDQRFLVCDVAGQSGQFLGAKSGIVRLRRCSKPTGCACAVFPQKTLRPARSSHQDKEESARATSFVSSGMSGKPGHRGSQTNQPVGKFRLAGVAGEYRHQRYPASGVCSENSAAVLRRGVETDAGNSCLA